MVNYSLTDSSALDAGKRNGTGSHTGYDYDYEYNFLYIFSIFNILICIFGILGNGTVIWLLGFRIKRNPFTTYVLNLAIADFGFLTTDMIWTISSLEEISSQVRLSFSLIYHSMFSTSQFLLTVISMDRCISVFFPLWYRCHRPTHLSAILCALIWVFSFLQPAIHFILGTVFLQASGYASVPLMVNSSLCLPLMIISSLILFIKVCCKSKQQKRRKVLTTILATVFFFLLFSFPFNTLYIMCLLFDIEFRYISFATVCACLNSSVNPLIYYLVGRPKKGRSNRSMKAALQKLFEEEGN